MATKMFNTSLEDFAIQCDSKFFQFNKRSSTLVDDHLVQFVYAQTKDRGVFPVYPSMTKDQVKKEARLALLSYLDATLRQRIRNYIAQQDDYKKKGITWTDDVRLTRAIRWEKEIVDMLEMEAPIHEELSFLSAKRREELGIKDDRVMDFEGESLFDSDDILAENDLATPDVLKRKAGRPAKKAASFEDVDLDKEIEV